MVAGLSCPLSMRGGAVPSRLSWIAIPPQVEPSLYRMIHLVSFPFSADQRVCAMPDREPALIARLQIAPHCCELVVVAEQQCY